MNVTSLQKGATIIEINIKTSAFTPHITDILLEGKATEVMKALYDEINFQLKDKS